MTGLDTTLQALAEPTRRHVVELLLTRPRRPSELSSACAMSPPAMSRHLRVLRQTGLIEDVRVRGDARVRMYRLRPEPFRDLKAWLTKMDAFWTDQLGAFKRHVDGEGEGAEEES